MKTKLRLIPGKGFTLIEMLVTLAIVALVTGILAQAMSQLARIETLLEQGQLQGLGQAVRGEWVRDALVSLLPGEPGSDERFQGSSTELQGLSAEVPRWPTPGLATLRLRLHYDAAAGATALQVIGNAVGQDNAQVTALMTWPGRTGRFRYLDESGEWQDAWPPLSLKTAPALPLAVLLETGLPEMRVLLAAPQASKVPMPSLSQLERF